MGGPGCPPSDLLMGPTARWYTGEVDGSRRGSSRPHRSGSVRGGFVQVLTWELVRC